MIKAIIFDWGGVLIKSPSKGIREYCAKQLGTNPEKFWDVVRLNIKAFQTGLSEKEFWKKVCGELKIQEPKKPLWKIAIESAYEENEEIIDLIKRLKPLYKIGMLTNTEKPSVSIFEGKNYPFFDDIVFSCRVGITKPDDMIYLLAAKRLGCEPDEIIFIDDRQENVDGATNIGMQGILFIDTEKLMEDLRDLGIVI